MSLPLKNTLKSLGESQYWLIRRIRHNFEIIIVYNRNLRHILSEKNFLNILLLRC